METHNHRITRLRSKVKDCELGQLGNNETMKLVIILHIQLDQLQTSIIQKDLELNKVLSTARALELTQRKIQFIKSNNLKPVKLNKHNIAAIHKGYSSEWTPQHQRGDKGGNRSRTYEFCCYWYERPPHECKAWYVTCNYCQKRDYFEKV